MAPAAERRHRGAAGLVSAREPPAGLFPGDQGPSHPVGSGVRSADPVATREFPAGLTPGAKIPDDLVAAGKRGVDLAVAPELPDALLAAGERGATVAVAMSGGVDSSVAAALCLSAGCRVVGFTLRLWSDVDAGANRCCGERALLDVATVAHRLGIPCHVLDYADAFKADVVDAWLSAAARGETPNPCFACNERIRFGRLLAEVRELGAEFLATGHYARIRRDKAGHPTLRRGADERKDQSYMLYRLGAGELARVLFPVGAMTKQEVRQRAAACGLSVAGRPDSLDLCWLGQGGLAAFLDRHALPGANEPGPIVDRSGRVLGRHAGLARYTVGQRHGLGLGGGGARYVLELDSGTNTLVVGTESDLLRIVVEADRARWAAGRAPTPGQAVLAQTRYRASASRGVFEPRGESAFAVRFDEPQRAPTPGQGLVVYDGDTCLGGGLIRGGR